MKTGIKTTLVAAGLAVAGQPAAREGLWAQEWTFSGIERVDLRGVSGDLVVRRGSGDGIRLILEEDVEPRDAMRAEVEQRGAELRVDERWGGYGGASGHVRWTLEVPASGGPRIEFRTSSGGIEVSGVEGEFDLRTSSGDVDLEDVGLLSSSRFSTSSGTYDLTRVEVEGSVSLSTSSGDVRLRSVQAGRDFSFSTSSGDVVIEDSRGVLRGTSSSGDVTVLDAPSGPSRFSSSSGTVDVRLARTPEYDLEASSSSGDVRLEGSLGDNFTLVLIRRADRGRFDIPFAFDTEERFLDNGREYVRGVVRRGTGAPEIVLRTASGSIDVSG